MRSTRTIVFGCALVAAALIFFGIIRAIQKSNGPSPSYVASRTAAAGGPGPGATEVAARSGGQIAQAATDIPAGSIITREMLEMKDSNGAPTQGYVTDPDAQAVGYITRVAIPRGGKFRPEDDFVGHISQVGVAGALRPGTRALVVPVPGKPTLHDLVKIGNSVDVLASFDGQEARTIAQNVRVLAVDVFANDFPQVNAAMRGPYKATPQGRAIVGTPTAPGAASTGANVPPDTVAPSDQPAPTPANLPPLDPALTLEVTPQQAAAIQLALASQAPIDFLVRPALPANRSSEVTLVSAGDGTGDDENGETIANSVTKRQIAPYAEAVKNRNSGGNSGNGDSGGAGGAGGGNGNAGETRLASSGSSRPSRVRSNPLPVPNFPDVTTTSAPSTPSLPTPFNPANAVSSGSSGSSGNGEFGGSGSSGGERLAPRAPSTYQIPIYSDGGVVRTETVPVPIR